MSQLTATADRVSDWAGLGVKFPEGTDSSHRHAG